MMFPLDFVAMFLHIPLELVRKAVPGQWNQITYKFR